MSEEYICHYCKQEAAAIITTGQVDSEGHEEEIAVCEKHFGFVKQKPKQSNRKFILVLEGTVGYEHCTISAFTWRSAVNEARQIASEPMKDEQFPISATLMEVVKEKDIEVPNLDGYDEVA